LHLYVRIFKFFWNTRAIYSSNGWSIHLFNISLAETVGRGDEWKLRNTRGSRYTQQAKRGDQTSPIDRSRTDGRVNIRSHRDPLKPEFFLESKPEKWPVRLARKYFPETYFRSAWEHRLTAPLTRGEGVGFGDFTTLSVSKPYTSM
jgi:hypothetical protein